MPDRPDPRPQEVEVALPLTEDRQVPADDVISRLSSQIGALYVTLAVRDAVIEQMRQETEALHRALAEAMAQHPSTA